MLLLCFVVVIIIRRKRGETLSHLLWLSVLSVDGSFRASTAFVDHMLPEHPLFPEMSRPLNFAASLLRVKKERGNRC